MSEPILKVTGASIHFGGLQAINRLSFEIEEGQIFSLIGPNGAGKTTAINLITGIYALSSGEIYFQSRPLKGKKPHQMAFLGMARTFQNIQVFGHMTVRENVMVGMHTRTRSGFLRCLLHLPPVGKEEKRTEKAADDILAFLGLTAKADLRAEALPYGDQKRVEVARTLAADPKLLLLDEPVAGLNIRETEEMSRTILDIRERGITVILVEHDMNLVMGISDHITVLNYGEKIAEGRPEEVRDNPKVVEAYLGEEF